MSDNETEQSSTEQSQPSVYNGSLEGFDGEVTPEHIESYWRNRFSQADRAHAAETKALREQVAGGTAKQAETNAEANPLADEVKRLTEALQAERTNTRRARYPNAAQALGEEYLATIDEARLAGLNEALSASVAPRVDANNPARKVSAPKQSSEMSRDELLALFKSTPFPKK